MKLTNEYQRLAGELKSVLEQYKPTTPTPLPRVHRSTVFNREKRANWKKLGLTTLGKPRKLNEYKVKTSVMFDEIGLKLGISNSAVRARFYRGHLPKCIVNQYK